MSERWKPEAGKIYWAVDFCYIQNTRPLQWADDRIDLCNCLCGNCFKTQKEAEAAAEKVKALLLSLHDTTQVKELPDCYKVGEWVAYYTDKGHKYFKIAKIELNRLYSEDGKFSLMCNVGQAHLRPYNADEMKALVGKVVSNEHGNMFLVTAFVADDGGEVCVNGVVYNAGDLLECYTIDGNPCGVLEHLNENGEWEE